VFVAIKFIKWKKSGKFRVRRIAGHCARATFWEGIQNDVRNKCFVFAERLASEVIKIWILLQEKKWERSRTLVAEATLIEAKSVLRK